jgi:hypothetical protein
MRSLTCPSARWEAKAIPQIFSTGLFQDNRLQAVCERVDLQRKGTLSAWHIARSIHVKGYLKPHMVQQWQDDVLQVKDRWRKVLKEPASNLHDRGSWPKGQHRQNRQSQHSSRPGRFDIPTILVFFLMASRIKFHLLRPFEHTSALPIDQLTHGFHHPDMLTTQPGLFPFSTRVHNMDGLPRQRGKGNGLADNRPAP